MYSYENRQEISIIIFLNIVVNKAMMDLTEQAEDLLASIEEEKVTRN